MIQSNWYYLAEPVDTSDLPERFLEAFGAILAHSNYAPALDAANRLLARCGRCSVTCPIYQASDLQRDNPCWRSDLLLKVYRNYFTPMGTLRSRLGGGFQLDTAYIRKMAEEYYRCTACRRCRLDCPMGIDHAMITHLSRWVLAEVGLIPKGLRVAVQAQLEGPARNTSAIPNNAVQDTCEFLEDDCAEEYGIKVKFPFDEENADFLFFPAVSDYLLEPETLMGNAAMLGATSTSWTIGTGYFDGINYGLFYSDRMHEQIIGKEFDELQRLKVKNILIGECGHASRAAKDFVRTFWDAKRGPQPEVVNIVDYAYRQWKAGKLKLKPGVIKERVTYHDPCNIARSGWVVDQPRELLKHICADYVEMTPGRTINYCCGGGGGTVSVDEIREFRTGYGGRTKAEQMRATGAEYVVAPCANCKKQLREVCEDNDLASVQIVGLHDLMLKAIEVPDEMKVTEQEAGDGAEA
jgi:Fe-S oxidoreductase